MRFTRQFMIQRDLGKVMGMTSTEIGKYLTAKGYREKRYGKFQPTDEAKSEHLVDQDYRYSDPQDFWDVEKVVGMMEADGYVPAFPPPSDLVFEPQLKGPFSLKHISGSEYSVVSSNGDVTARIVGSASAEIVLEALNIAHERGFIQRRLNPTT